MNSRHVSLALDSLNPQSQKIDTTNSYRNGLLIALAFLLVFWPKYVAFGPQGARISPFTTASILGLATVGWGFFITAISRGSARTDNGAIYLIFALYWIVRLFSDFTNGHLDSISITLRDFFFYGLMFLLASALAPRSNLSSIFNSMLLAMAIIGGLAVFELIQQRSLSSSILETINLNVSDDMRSVLTSSKDRDYVFRSQSVFTHPIVLGEVAAAILPISIAMLLSSQGFLRKLIPFAGFVGAILSLYLCQSRSAQLAALVAISAYFSAIFLLGRRNNAVAAIYFAPVLICVAVIGFGYATYLAQGKSQAEARSSEVRSQMWERGWPAIVAKPALGHGDGLSASLGGFNTSSGDTIDDFYLTTILDSGLSGLVTFFLFIMVVLSTAASQYVADIKARRLMAAQIAAIVSIVVTQKIISIPEATGDLYFIAGLLVATISWNRDRNLLTDAQAPPVSN